MGSTFLYRLDPRAKILGFVGFTTVVVSTPGRAVWAFILYAALLVFLAGWARVPLSGLLKRLALVLPVLVAVAVFLPFLGRGSAPGIGAEQLFILWNAGAKAVLGTFSVSLLGLTTTFPQLVSGLERLRTPAVIVLIVSFMARYAVVFAEELSRTRRALVSRNFRARWLANVPVLGHMLGALFLRSYGRGERVYLAMLSRGYQGRAPLLAAGRFGRAEAVFLAVLVGASLSIRLILPL